MIDLIGPAVSQPYINLTLDVMKQFGVNAFQVSDTCFEVLGVRLTHREADPWSPIFPMPAIFGQRVL